MGGLAAGMCSCCPPPAQASGWNYTCPGPDGWEGACQDGISQSPIDLPFSTLEQIRFNYPESFSATVINNGHGSPQVGMHPGGLLSTERRASILWLMLPVANSFQFF